MLRRRISGWDRAAYVPLLARGTGRDQVVAFARILDQGIVAAVAPRLPAKLLQDQTMPLIPAERWDETTLELPEGLRRLNFVNAITGDRIESGAALKVADLLRHFPVALLSDRPIAP
jgi:(1->4)-alpha-D-glucan 1-alpha-D-glucosylmutase